jgi:integrase
VPTRRHTAPSPTSRPYVRIRAGGPYWYAKWSRNGRPVVRALGRAWVEVGRDGAWRPKRGRPPEGILSEPQATERMLALVREHHELETRAERDETERRRRGVTFRELAHEYLRWIADVKDARPSTLDDYGWVLAEPERPFRRGKRVSKGLVMAALGDRPAAEVTTREVEDMLRAVARTGVSPRTVNKSRAVVCAIFNYAMRPSTYGLSSNPATHADRRRQSEPPPLEFYSPEEIEALARALAGGAHRDVSKLAIGPEEATQRAVEDAQDAELVRIAAYTGLRRGELIALRWRDVDFVRCAITVRRAVSGGVEVQSTKSRRARQVPLTDQVAAALERLSRRGDFTSPDDYVFVNRLGRRVDPTALTRRFARARDTAGLPPLRFHGLRHTYGSLLVAGGVDLVSVKAAMGHAQIATTERYLHARPASELAERFTRALAGSTEAFVTGEMQAAAPDSAR